MRLRAKAPDSAESAKQPGLRYVSGREPGIARRGPAGAFVYIHPDGRPVRDAATLGRIRSLVVPPAWKNVWIFSRPNGHLQATGSGYEVAVEMLARRYKP